NRPTAEFSKKNCPSAQPRSNTVPYRTPFSKSPKSVLLKVPAGAWIEAFGRRGGNGLSSRRVRQLRIGRRRRSRLSGPEAQPIRHCNPSDQIVEKPSTPLRATLPHCNDAILAPARSRTRLSRAILRSTRRAGPSLNLLK